MVYGFHTQLYRKLIYGSADTNGMCWINYSVFNYMPQNFEEEIDTEVLVGKLNKLNDLQPDLHIYQVYTLKYKENLTVAEISQQLQVSENSVIDALDKIVSLI